MKFLVTGATGMIGRAVCARCAEQGIAVRAATRSPALVAGVSEHVQVGSIGPDTVWDDALRGVSVVIHIAGPAHACTPSSEAECRLVNTEGTRALALAAATAGVERMVLLSTAKVHGDRRSGDPIRESDPPAPQDPYAMSKLHAELAMKAIGRRFRAGVAVVRSPLVYGSGVKANFRALMRAVDRRVPLPFGSVRNARSLIYVENLADALVCCGTAPGAAGQTFLVADGAPISTPDLVRAIAAALHRRPLLISVNPRLLLTALRFVGKGEAALRLLGSFPIDDSFVRATLGWSPRVGFKEGLERTVAWYRSTQSHSSGRAP